MIAGLLPLPARIAASGRDTASLVRSCHAVVFVVALALVIALSDGSRHDTIPSSTATVGVVSVGKRLVKQPQVPGQFAWLEGRDTILALVQEHRRGMTDVRHRALADAIYLESLAANIDPLMVASIVARESSFKSGAVSHAGAVGLMQLRPFVARDVALRADVEWRGLDTLNDPEMNLRLGILYYKQLVERFDGDERKALTAYNFGPTRVSRSLQRGEYRGSSYADTIIELYDRISEGTVPPA